MEAEIAVGNRQKLGKTYLLLLSLATLAIGVFGITRSWVRPGVPFTWETREQRVVIQSVLAQPSALLPGDVLLGSDGVPLRHSEELEFLLDGIAANGTVSLTVLRHGQQIVAPMIMLGHWHYRREVIINLILGLFLWAIGTWVILRQPEDRAARLFFLLALSLVALIMINTGRLPAGPRPWSYFLPVVHYFVYPYFPALFLHFATQFPREKKFLRSAPQQAGLIYLPAGVFALLLEFFHLRALFSGKMPDFREYHLVLIGIAATLCSIFSCLWLSYCIPISPPQTRARRTKCAGFCGELPSAARLSSCCGLFRQFSRSRRSFRKRSFRWQCSWRRSVLPLPFSNTEFSTSRSSSTAASSMLC